MNEDKCPVCLNISKNELTHDRNHSLVNLIFCSRCGIFYIGSFEMDFWKRESFSNRQRAIASSRIREMGDRVTLSRRDEEHLFHAQDIPVLEKADRLLLAIQQKTEFIGASVTIAGSDLKQQAQIWSLSWEETEGLLNLMHNKFWIGYRESSESEKDVFIQEAGWERLDGLRGINLESQQGFVAMWFGEEVNHIYSECIAPAIELAGYLPHRVDKKEYADRIDDEIIMQIRRSKFVVADLTGHRGGVYYEAGFAHGLGLKVFFSCRDDHFKDLHFDIAHYNCIRWFPQKLDEFKNSLSARIEAEFGKGPRR